MNGNKSLLESKTAHGIAVAGVVSVGLIVCQLLGIEIAEEQLTKVVSAVFVIGGSLYGMYGRYVATKRIA